MNSNRLQLLMSWVVMSAVIYTLVEYNITYALIVAVLIFFIRDYENEKKSAIEYFSNSKIFHMSKTYAAITSFMAFIFVVYKIMNSEYGQLISNGYALIYILLLIIFFPFILLAILHEIHLFRKS